ncbi:hypothetical protein CY35_03G031500 [Sphagnum magellanicum]|nr:hypothetical protein CY35_03G031500 [Sphagnum magellanicum]
MRLQPQATNRLDAKVVKKIRKKVTANYVSWCNFIRQRSNLELTEEDERLELLYTALFLLIWGESANLRFMPECLCYMFHHMSRELNRMLNRSIDEHSAMPAKPRYSEPNEFLNKVVTPLYKAVQAEAKVNKDGKAPHSQWRNYDDMNEYFWTNRCFKRLGWLEESSNYLVAPDSGTKHKVGKTGFVEQRSFFNIFRSFDRLWIGHILVLQAIIVTLWSGSGAPWIELQNRDSLARFLAIFITWAALRFFQGLMDLCMQHSLVSRDTLLIGVRMVLKLLVAAGWIVIFAVFYRYMWNQRHHDHAWTKAANKYLIQYVEAAAVFVIPEVLALLLFIIPWLRNAIENSSWRIFHVLTWWFQSRIYVARGLREGLFDNFKYTLFWVLVLASKFAFSYFLQIKPLIKPTKEILRITDIQYKWPQFFSHGNRVAVVALWAPVILIYFMDLQIWYTVWSSFVGALVGLFEHLGEIRNVLQLRQRFQIFPSAVQFNLMPEEVALPPQFFRSWWVYVKAVFTRFKLRYGWAVGGVKEDSKQLEAGRFAKIWNHIIDIFREEDLISDSELELLEMPSTQHISVFQWPSTLLANEVRLAVEQVQKHKGNDKSLWRKICANDYRRCAVIESYETIKFVLREIVRENTTEYQRFLSIYEEIDMSIRQNGFTTTFKLKELPKVHEAVLELVKDLLAWPTHNDPVKVVVRLQNLYEVVLCDFTKDIEVERKIRDSAPYQHQANGQDSELPVNLPSADNHSFFKQLKRLQTTLSTKESLFNVPKGLEARRRISFFSNSLFMTMPRAPSVDKMLAFSVLTPYYKEDVIYSMKALSELNEDGVSILYYLKTIFADDWQNFKQRFPNPDPKPDQPENDTKFIARMEALDDAIEIRMWASYRGQTLARTVRGMMYYERALEFLAFLDTASESEVLGFKELVVRSSSLSREGSLSRHKASTSDSQPLDTQAAQNALLATAAMKFTYVVAAQEYGKQKINKEDRAWGISWLMRTYKGLRIAYVDEVKVGSEIHYFSVLVKYDPIIQEEVEIYRVRLPGPFIGEGKPENQNHAIIFTRGDALQTIDMNQEMYFEEALKMRNLLQEFNKYYGIRKPAILGVREHVFTGAVSSLAWFMSAQETSFVTLGQRVLANPLKVRMHYGHPDVFDRLWFLSRGGISKASKTINISEDIFAGFNCTERGGTVTHHEYIQAGKGRDVGLNQISLFEAKVSSGNGEQVLSRDVYRLGHHLDFFRMLSFYYTTVGFFINNMIIVLVVYAFLWGRVYLTLSGVEASLSNTSDALHNTALTASLNQQFLVQLGLLTALPMVVENALEHGFLRALWEFFTMQLQLASVFFTFSMGTRAHYFGRTLLHGGAKYRPTGRGFVVKHESFAVNYRFYARSHFTKGIELILLLIVYETYGSFHSSVTYVLITVTSWFLALTWILAPFIFNPSGFDWLKTVEDYDDFMSWLWYKGGIITDPEQSWEAWWLEEQGHLRTTGFWGKVLDIVLDLRFFFFQYGIVYHLHIASNNHSIAVYLTSWSYVLVAGVINSILSYAHEHYAARRHRLYRAIQAIVLIVVVAVITVLLIETPFKLLDLLTSLLAFVPTGWGILQICLVLRPLLERYTWVWGVVVAVARLYEMCIGLIVMAPVAILSWLPGFQAMQTRVLFNEAFSRGLQISRIFAGKKNPDSWKAQ